MDTKQVHYSWTCPECHIDNKRSAEDIAMRGQIGTVQCTECKSRFELQHLLKHGFIFESFI